jgi:outer membrane protein OmpA-like peptidoglycan-associated protein
LGDGYDALIWLVLIALLGLYGWYAASLQSPVEEPAVVALSALDTAIQGMDAEQADLERQLAEAKGRIAALEEAVSQQRQPTAAPQPSVALSDEPLPSAPSLASQVAELGGRQTGQGLLLELAHSDLRFPIGQSTLPPGDHAILDRVADLLLQHPTVAARVEGHTDSAGRDEVNLTLSQERAEVVKEALVRRGVGEVRILAVGHGETRPIDDNTSQAGRDRNRRIEIYFTEPPG